MILYFLFSGSLRIYHVLRYGQLIKKMVLIASPFYTSYQKKKKKLQTLFLFNFKNSRLEFIWLQDRFGLVLEVNGSIIRFQLIKIIFTEISIKSFIP